LKGEISTQTLEHNKKNMADTVVKGKNIDASKVTFSTPNILDNGAKLVYVNYDGGRFTIQTPWMGLPWAMSSYTDDKYPKHSVTLSFRGMEENDEMQKFHDNMKAVEKAAVQAGVQNSVQWFKKKNLSEDVVSNLFNPIVRVSTDKEGIPDGKYPPTLRLKVPQRDGVWEPKVFDTSGNMYHINDRESGDVMEDILVKGAKIRCMMQCVGLWIASGNYMCQWKLTRAEVDVPETTGNHTFLPDSDDEGEDDVAASGASSAPAAPAPSKVTPNMLDDSDDSEEEAAPEPDPEPEPVKKPKKKIVKKTKA